jgi:hypothetical protein
MKLKEDIHNANPLKLYRNRSINVLENYMQGMISVFEKMNTAKGQLDASIILHEIKEMERCIKIIRKEFYYED